MAQLRLLLVAFLLSAVSAEKVEGGGKQTTESDAVVMPTQASFNITQAFLQALFNKYGDGEYMPYEGFEHLMENLGLGHLAIDGHNLIDHYSKSGFEQFHPSHDHLPDDRKNTTNQGKNHSSHDSHASDTHDDHTMPNGNNNTKNLKIMDKNSPSGETGIHKKNITGSMDTQSHDHHDNHSVNRTKRHAVLDPKSQLQNRCLTPSEILITYGLQEAPGISPTEFLQICPAIVVQLDERTCIRQGSDITSIHNHNHDHDHDHPHENVNKTITAHSFLTVPAKVWGCAITAILVISLAGLIGVAAVPIINKVLYSHLLHFLVALAIGSMTGDACLHLLPHALASTDSHDHEGESHGHDKSAVYKGLMVLLGMYGFFLAERLMGTITQCRKKRKGSPQGSPKLQRKEYQDEIGEKLSKHNQYESSCENIVMIVHPGKDARNLAATAHEDYHKQQCLTEDEDEDTGVKGHSHGHGHGHSHGNGKVPSSVATVAWMVIMGDGLHNFCDGLAVGTAFANSISGGISTAVAVFCHELPHELGDFAMLLQAGMSAKQALVYNLVSSALSFIGMLIGVALGNVASATAWIFSLTGGMFIYIALVDMLPEITAVKSANGKTMCGHLVLQLFGILCGASIMLVIALFEDKIKVGIGS